MAGKIKHMSKIKQLIQLHQQGISIRKIARATAMSRNTVKTYLHKIELDKWDTRELLKLDDIALEKRFHAGNPAYTDKRFDVFKSQLDYFVKELERKGHSVTQILLWEEYKEKHPDGYQYTQFCYHLKQHLKAKTPSMVLVHKPGDELYIDFAGRTVSYIDRLTGVEVVCQLFVATMPYSDYGFVLAVASQKIPDFIYAIEQCFIFLGGVPKIVVPDNLKSAVIKASRYEPTLSDALNQFANYYDFGVMPARVRKPKDKALVENHVNMAYQRILAPLRNQVFFSLSDLNKAISLENQKVNQKRMQVKDYSREEAFLSAEKGLLAPMPNVPFLLEKQHLATVQKNNHVLLSEDGHYYSVPYQHIGKKAKIIYDRTKVVIFVNREQVAVHLRKTSRGQYTTVQEHLCSFHQRFNVRSPEYYIESASRKSEVLKEYVQYIFEGAKYPELKYKTCDGLLNLYKSYKDKKEDFERACQIAMSNQVRTYQFVKDILANGLCQEGPSLTSVRPLPEHNNIRGAQYYLDFSSSNTSQT
jgi:transposase